MKRKFVCRQCENVLWLDIVNNKIEGQHWHRKDQKELRRRKVDRLETEIAYKIEEVRQLKEEGI
jgi:hypothetical protein